MRTSFMTRNMHVWSLTNDADPKLSDQALQSRYRQARAGSHCHSDAGYTP